MQKIDFHTFRVANCGDSFTEEKAVAYFGRMLADRCERPAPCPKCQMVVTAHRHCENVSRIRGPFFDKYPFKSQKLSYGYDFGVDGSIYLSVRAKERKQFSTDDEFEADRHLALLQLNISSIVVVGAPDSLDFWFFFLSKESVSKFNDYLLELGFTTSVLELCLRLEKIEKDRALKIINIIKNHNELDDESLLHLKM